MDEIGTESTVRTYLSIMRQQRWWIICVILLGLGAGIGFSFLQKPQYSATAQVLIQGNSAAVTPQQAIAPSVLTELQVVTSAPVRQLVARQLGSAPDVSAAEVGQANVISISATSRNATWSTRVANAYAHAFVTYQQEQVVSSFLTAENELHAQIASLARQARNAPNGQEASALLSQEALLKEQLAQTQIANATAAGNVIILTPAQQPTAPNSPTLLDDALIGLAIGLTAAIVIAILRNNLNDTLASKGAVERLSGAPVLALVPLVTSWRKRSRPLLVASSAPTSPAAESYRSLRTALQFARQERELRTILITSPASSEGKTATVANLGTVFAQAGERVALVSADLRRPRLGQFFELAEEVGLSSVLLGQHSLQQALQPISGHRNLWVLPAGSLPPNPAELLNGAGAAQFLTALKKDFDIVIIDSPPVLPVTDAVVLARQADATLLVTSVSQTRRADLRRAAEKLNQVNAQVIGTVLNQVTKAVSYGYGLGSGYEYKVHLPGHAAAANGTSNGNGSASPADAGSRR